MINPI